MGYEGVLYATPARVSGMLDGSDGDVPVKPQGGEVVGPNVGTGEDGGRDRRLWDEMHRR